MRARDIIDIFRLPRVSINLMFEKTTINDPFFGRVVKNFYKEATSRHPKLPFIKALQYGFALCVLPVDFNTYFMSLKSSARGNYRKAHREGYAVKRFDFNAHLDDVREILQSSAVRQGKFPPHVRESYVHPINDPPSRTPYHDYPYFGVFRGGKLFAYASCLVAGELCNMADFYGHIRYERDGLVSLLVIEIVQELFKSFPAVKYFGYGTYFGASESMRRFKRKFLFYPYRADWILGDTV
jgi:hypothetical protein